AAAMVVSVDQPDLRRAFTFALTVLTGWLIARHRRGVMEPQPSALTFHVRALTTALAITALAMYLVMGTIRETARGPETVRGVISIDDDRAASAGQRAQLRAEP
ncbi:MAG TPA: hypothetical protein VFA38_06845, partial [Nitrospirales bacterium]|nr:hypothetical protein [Nitrospirales bacterium]